MRSVRITFRTIEDDEDTPSLEKTVEVSAEDIRNARITLLPKIAEQEAWKFWEALIQMDRLG